MPLTFTMMLGITGAGKSTLAQFIAPELNAHILSFREVRRELYGDETNRHDYSRIFKLMDERAQKYLSNGESVIYDATNLWAKPRQKLLAKLPEEVTKECVWLKTPLELAILHDGDRDAPTPRGIIQMQAMMLQPPSYKEGWDYIRIVGT